MPVTRDDVLSAFKMLLGRGPKGERAIAAHLRCTSIQQLRLTIMRSPEFHEILRRETAWALLPDDPALSHGPISVQWHSSRAQLDACLKRVRDNWERLGIDNPFFSVLSEHRFLPNLFAQHETEFWTSGERDARNLVALLAFHGLSQLATKICFELGSGVGRITLPLAQQFSKVVGFDVSRDHIKHASRQAAATNTATVAFQYCGDLSVPWRGRCDGFYSRLVLQHNPPPLMAEFIRRGLHTLKRGGIAVLQIPTYRAGYSFDIAHWLRTPKKNNIEMHCLPQRAVFEIATRSSCSLMEVRTDNAAGTDYVSKVFVIQKTPCRGRST